MAKRDAGHAAEFGTLDAQAHRDLMLVRAWSAERDRRLAVLFGGLSPSVARQELIVISLSEFGLGRHHEIKYFQTECHHLAGATAIRDELHNLAGLDLFVLNRSSGDRRRTIVCPTKRLVSWASETVPKLEKWALRFFVARGEPSP